MMTSDGGQSQQHFPHVMQEVNPADDQRRMLLPVFRQQGLTVSSELPAQWRYWLGIAQAVAWTDGDDVAARLAASTPTPSL
jgi:hypothetical protein